MLIDEIMLLVCHSRKDRTAHAPDREKRGARHTNHRKAKNWIGKSNGMMAQKRKDNLTKESRVPSFPGKRIPIQKKNHNLAKYLSK